jgi:hypothetical protein
MSTELYLPRVIEKKKREPRPKITWTCEMVETLRNEFPTSFNKELAKKLGVSWRSLVRKARELGIEKEANFIESRRPEIVKMIARVRKANPKQTGKGFVVPNSEQYRFKAGHVPRMKHDRGLIDKVHKTRNETIKRERIRIKYGLPRITKLNLQTA